ncbi:autotransporter outer membrane beta-barrel domain-containing protein [Microvirga sp. W0021]|uniref:Autotransporter outer membrane beta-barrel domain-containing protein n=1 Tax=Hohaiivirga grylli TaxID=3133970 RepID=A0ABV0BP53_9HYPH
MGRYIKKRSLRTVQTYKSTLLAGTAVLSLLIPSAVLADTCTATTCVSSSTSTNTATATGGADLTFQNSVNISTGSVALNADSSKITFNQNVDFVASSAIGNSYWLQSLNSTIDVKGNMDVTATSTSTNPFLQLSSTTFNVDGNLTFNVTAKSNGTPAGSINYILVQNGSVLNVAGHTQIDGSNASDQTSILMNPNGTLNFSTLTIDMGTVTRAKAGNLSGVLTSTGATVIKGGEWSQAIWASNVSTTSLGESTVTADQLRATYADKPIIVNIGADATIDTGRAVTIISAADSLVLIKGQIYSTHNSDNTVVYGNSRSDEVRIQGNAYVEGWIETGAGDDSLYIESGQFIGSLDAGTGNDKFVITGGSATTTNGFYMGSGNDHFEISGGKIAGAVFMGFANVDTGHNTALITGTADISELVRLDGGANGLDANATASLTIDNYNLSGYMSMTLDDLSKGVNLVNWTEMNIVNGSTLTLTSSALFFRMSNPAVENVLNIDATSTVTNSDISPATQTIAASVFNAGTMRLDGNSVAGDKWTIRGNYTGMNGTLMLDTVLGDDSSLTDLLYITGDVAGMTNVVINNRGGLGALTTGDGIKIIEIDGASPSDAFALRSDYTYQGTPVVVGGAYVYSLNHNGVTNTSDGNWYLRSVFDVPDPVDPPPTDPDPTPDPDPKLPDTGGPSVVPPTKPTPVYQPGVPIYEVYPQVLLAMNRLGTLEQRVGNRMWSVNKPGTATSQQAGNVVEDRGLWIRLEGSTSHINPAKSTSQAHYDLDMLRAQIGLDFLAAENEKGKLIGGVYFQYVHANSDIRSRFGSGKIKSDGYGLGGTLTWYGNNDVYVDGVAQVMWYDTDITSDTLGRKEVSGNKGTGYALSIEAGRKIKLNEEWTMTPQIQLSYNAVDFKKFQDAYGAVVRQKDSDSLTARLGVAFSRENEWRSEQGDLRRLKTYGIANLYYEFLDGTEVSVTNVNFRNRSDRFWGGIGAGVSYNWNDDAYSLYGEVDARTSFSDFGSSYALNGTIGFRAKF